MSMLALAERIRARTGDSLPSGLRSRSFAPEAINDAFDLSEALLRSDSIFAALRVRTRTELVVLSALTEHPVSTKELSERVGLARDDVEAALDTLNEVFLAHHFPSGEWTTYAEVSNALQETGVEISPPRALSPAPLSTNAIDTTLLDRLGAEKAAQTIAGVTEFVVAIAEEPARELAKGGLALPDLKRFATLLQCELDHVDGFKELAAAAGLALVHDGYWRETVEAESWLHGDTAERWAHVATAWWHKVRPEISAAAQELVSMPSREGSWSQQLRALVRWMYPAASEPALRAALNHFEDDAHRLGLEVSAEATQIGRALYAHIPAEILVQQLRELLPPSVDRVYVQPDLSIIAPGPLLSALDRQLREFSHVEKNDVASSYRLSSDSLNRGLAAGVEADHIRALLTEISLSGIPQPVDYLLSETAARFGKIRVRELDRAHLPFASEVRSEDSHMLELLLVDQAVSALGLERSGPGVLRSRASAVSAFWTLNDAKYPVALESESGQIVRITRVHKTVSGSQISADPVAAMWTRITSATAEPAGTAWLIRQIEAAIRSKTPLNVVVGLPDGSELSYLIEAIGLANGRLRARDRKADVERTLPLSAIRLLTPAQ